MVHSAVPHDAVCATAECTMRSRDVHHEQSQNAL